jgi:small-conductance mechanosensitive channel
VTLLQTSVGGVQFDSSVVVGVLVILGGAYVLARILTFALSTLAEHSGPRRITVKMTIPIVKFFVYGAALYVVLGPLLQLSATQLLAVSGIFAAAIAFGLRDLFSGVIGGLVVILEQPYQVGDKVEIGDNYGEVTDISLRATTLVTADDTAVVVPNATLFTENVSNANSGNPEMMVVTRVSLAPDADIDRAMAIVEDALVTSKYVYIDDTHPVAVHVSDETFYREIRGKAYVADLRDEFAFSTDVTKRVLDAFDREGIETPEIQGRLPVDE